MLTLAQLVVLIILIVPLLLAMTNRLRGDVAALVIMTSLGVVQLAGLDVIGESGNPDALNQLISGFSRPVVLTLISLFIISRALDKTGFTHWLGRRIAAFSGKSERRMMSLFMLTALLMALFMNNVAVGAVLLPGAMVAARRSGIKPSRLLIPISFGTLLGGAATYFTTANIIVDTMLRSANPPQASLDILAFTPTGGLIAVIGLAFMAIFGRWLLPDRDPPPEFSLSTPTGSDLEKVYSLGERLWEARVLSDSPLVGQTLAQAAIGERFGITVIVIWHGRQATFHPKASQVIRAHDILVTVGNEARMQQLADQGLEVKDDTSKTHVSERGVSLVEAILAPHSQAEGKSLKDLDFRQRFGFTAVALLHAGRSYRTNVASHPLHLGDSLLLAGDRSNLKRIRQSDQFIVLDTDSSDQPLRQREAIITLTITGIAVLAAILGVPVYLTMLCAALLMILPGLIGMEDAYRAIEWQVIFLVAGMYSLSLAMQYTGLTALIGQKFVELAQPFGSIGLAAGCFLLSVLLTHIMGGQVTALITGPIAISAAIHLNTSPQAIAVATAIGCSAAYLTPMAHPVNMMMMSPGNYRFTDFVKPGLPLLLITFLGLILSMKLFWHL